MKFAIMIAPHQGTMRGQDETVVLAEAKQMMDTWIEKHLGKLVTCFMCGEQLRVDPEHDDPDATVALIPQTKTVAITCNECLKAFALAAVLSLEQDEGERLAARLVLTLIRRGRESMNQTAENRLSVSMVAEMMNTHVATLEPTPSQQGSDASTDETYKEAIRRLMR